MATLAGVGVLRLEIALGDFMNVFEAALCGAGFLHVRRTPSEKDCHEILERLRSKSHSSDLTT